MKTPKFKIGQLVNHKPDLYKCTQSKVVEIDRLFNNHDGSLAYIEHTLKSMNKEIKWEIIEGENPVLVIHPWMSTQWDSRTGKNVPYMKPRKEIKFDTYCYTVQSPKMRTVFSERQLKLAK
jgi:heat shock protein HspQ